MKKLLKKLTSLVVSGAMVFSVTAIAQPSVKVSAATDTYKARFMEMYNKIHDSKNGYFSSLGIPYHSVETLMCEAPDYGHETTSETFSYYLWLEAMRDSFSGDWSSFNHVWDLMEKYMIPSSSDQLETGMSKYNAAKPATYAPEYSLPSLYPSKLDSNAKVGSDPISQDLTSTYGTSLMYGMHWLLDTDNWYGYGTRGDGKTSPSFINTFQRGRQESVWETVPQPCWDVFNFGGKNGYLDLFTKDNSYSKQFKYTDAPDADARVVQATYDAALWAGNNASAITDKISKASKMGDYLRYAMFDKYFHKIGSSGMAGTGYDAAHYLLSWYYAWGGATDGGWSWKIGCSHSHFGYQNPMTAWILSQDSDFEPKSANGAKDWSKSLKRQLEMLQWLQSSEGAIAGGCSNSKDGQYNTWPEGTSTFYGMGYQENPVYEDPGSNQWFGWQTWAMQRVAEYYYTTNDATAKSLLDKWLKWAIPLVKFNSDGTFVLPSNLSWSGAPDTWTGKVTDNSNLNVTVKNYSTDLGVAGSLANTLLYYSKASGDTETKELAEKLLNSIYENYFDSKGVSAPETREDYSRFDDPVYIPEGWTGTMPNGDKIQSGSTFLSIRSKYKNDPDWSKVEKCLSNGSVPTFNYHRFWAEAEVAIAYGLHSKLYSTPENNSSIAPTTAVFDKNPENQDDISVTMTLNGNTFSGINNGSDSLVRGTDYTVSENKITILKSYLAKQPVGNTTLSFVFSAGTQASLAITVKDSSVVIPEGSLKVQMFNSGTQAEANNISPHFNIVNTGNTSINLSKVTLRYYYTEDGTQAQTFWCDWSTAGNDHVTGKFMKLAASKEGADHYLEIGFSSEAGTLAPNSSVEVQARFSKNDWSNYNQDDDYSFSPSSSSYADWEKVPAYLSGTLVWGQEPGE